METNETILTRKVVGIEDRKVLGTVAGLRVDCDTLDVSCYIVSSASTNAPLVLPFEQALAVGDTFLTVQSRAGFLPTSGTATSIVNDGFKLAGTEAYTKTGNRLGTVASFGFDHVFGAVTELVLDTGATFSQDQFVFFAPEFVFVDDGEKTVVELREARAGQQGLAEERARTEPEVEEGLQSGEEIEPEEELDLPTESALEGLSSEPEPEPASEPEPVDEDAELVSFLLGAVLSEDVASEDGAFTASRGTVLTQEIVDKARAHDALLLLTMAVDA